MYSRCFNVNRKTLSIIFCLVLISVFSLAIAYAVLSVTLNIVGSAQIVGSNWDIHIENVKVKSGSVSADAPTINSNTSISFSSHLTDPGDYYEFSFDVVNNGSIDAMIDGIIKTPELTTEQLKYLRYDVSYVSGEDVSSQQLLGRRTRLPIKVRVEFRNDIPISDLPKTETSLNLGISLVYIQDDGTGDAAPDFIQTTSYWIDTTTSDGKIYRISNVGYTDGGYTSKYKIAFGIRPVIEIPVSEFLKVT